MVNNKFEDNAYIDYSKLESLVRLGVNVLDETLDYGLEMLPLEAQKECALDWRAIGLGVFGLADMFVALKVKYGSDESIGYVSDVFDFMNTIALDESCNLAKKKGTFRKYNWDNTKESPLIKALLFDNPDLYYKIKENGLRNGTLLSVAPTGTISLLMGGYSGGVEPIFKVSYERSTHSMETVGKSFKVYAKSVSDLLAHDGISEELTNEQVKSKYPFVIESHEVDPLSRVKVQAIMQEYIDNAISSTVNLPEGTSASVIYDIYLEAWGQGLKGITVFVDGCKRGNILGVAPKKKAEPPKDEIVTKNSNVISYDTVKPISRRTSKEVSGKTYRLQTACVPKFYVHINKTDNGDIFEVFANPSSGCTSNISTITRLVSTMLRCGVSVDTIIEDLSTTKCPACQNVRRNGNTDIALSCGNAIADALSYAYKNKHMDAPKETLKHDTIEEDKSLLECPECGEKTLRLEAKCVTCSNCGYSLCS